MKIEVLDAIIDGHVKGEQLEVSDKSAQYLISIGYAKEVKAEETQKPARTRTTKK
ncbi:hypothetical protein [Bacillus sp. 03113]|uniref:hypothetical protein n=1 Tax=Bacillus sp. 03113 TaxID=2578211 RepID=UPI0015E8A6E3|nr:hypothetical protein [Bacillus sp. 03113]